MHFGEHRFALFNYFGMYDINYSAFPGDLMTSLYMSLYTIDLNREQFIFSILLGIFVYMVLV